MRVPVSSYTNPLLIDTFRFSGRGTYDIRHPADDPTPPDYMVDYLNQAHVQNAIGVNLNYTTANSDIYWYVLKAKFANEQHS